MNVIEGKMNARSQKIAIVISRFNSFITEKMFSGAIDILKRHDLDTNTIEAVWVPGAFELPLVCKKLAKSGKFDGVLALSCVIRGETPHFDYVSAEVSKGVASVSLETEIPVSYGVITADSTDQAIERAGVKAGNKGADAALALMESINVLKQI